VNTANGFSQPRAHRYQGDTYQIAGTTEVIGVRSNRVFPSVGVVTSPPIPGDSGTFGAAILAGVSRNVYTDFVRQP